MKLRVERLAPQRWEKLATWLLDQDDLAEACPSPRFYIWNHDQVLMRPENIRQMLELSIELWGENFMTRNPDWGVPLDFTIQGDDALVAWIKLKFL